MKSLLSLLVLSALLLASLAAATPSVDSIIVQADQAQVYFLAKNTPVAFRVECMGCDVLVTEEIDNVLQAIPFNYDKTISSTSIQGIFSRTAVKSSKDRALVLRNPSSQSMKILYSVSVTAPSATTDDSSMTMYILGFVVAVVAIAVLAIALFVVSNSTLKQRKVTRNSTIIPETMHAVKQINYGTYATALSGGGAVPQVTVHQQQQQQQQQQNFQQQYGASPVVPPVYFLYPVAPRYPGQQQQQQQQQQQHNNASASSAVDVDASIMTAPLYPAVKRANPI